MADVTGWEGLVLPYGSISPVGDPRVVLPTTLELARPLPLPVKVQWFSADAHDNAEQGLASITRVWTTDEGLWASGPIDVADPQGERLARKIRDGFLGWISADIETDGGEFVTTAEGRRPAFRNWRLTGVTLVGDPAFAAARVYPVTDADKITPVASVRRAPAAAFAGRSVTFSAGRRRVTVTVTSGGEETRQEIAVPFAMVHGAQPFAVVGDIDLPWASRDHAWDGPGAARRVQEWADGDPDRMSRAFLWRNEEADPTTQSAYSLGYADVIDGDLRAVYHGLAAAAGRLDQTENGMTAADRGRVRSRIDTLYERAASALDDPTIEERREDMADTEDFAVAEPGVVDAVVEVDDPDDRDVEISEASVQRIVDALVSRLDERDVMATAEFNRISQARAALEEVPDGLL